MDKQFTASEVRAEAHRHANEVEDMLNAYADLLEADEKAVPVMVVNHVSSAEHDLPIGMKLYTHPSPADTERLAEALQEILNYRGGAANALEDEYVVDRAHHALAAHSAQAQPPAASLTEEMVERARSAFVQADDGSTGITDAIRAALLAAQENPNG